ncbi:CoA transferase subunit A [Petrotoga sp. 9PWA.NaAc.5.4]|uniref:CoA transferase subunit A n=1 Tax=Petrotoga sp. 9PWA.NaAc.5.4 TaxID=1434328 RepID=UPI000CBB275E|nr:CoA-transferase [Petrotoga sp. 9PWA.NaAc.5.4]PNR92279.1 glutaconate CoA-transferase [Petrotoga sp. 9PWA.NaAc.5.4]
MLSEGELFTGPDPDEMRDFFRKKTKNLVNKLTTVSKAVSELINDGNYIAVGGFGMVRLPTAVLLEIVRQKKKNLGFSGHTATLDCAILVAGKTFNKCDISYVIGLEAFGIPKQTRKYFETEVNYTEWTNAALAWRYKAAAMGLSFIPIRTMMGTDTAKYSAAKEITCPFTDKKYLAVPALYPDVAIIHVHEADIYGNSHIRGITVSDQDLARAAKRVIITSERILPTEFFRNNPENTTIPFYLVDAVIEVPFGSYPGNMPYEYFLDSDYIRNWIEAEKDVEEYKTFINKNIFECKNFYDYLNVNGGFEKMKMLRNIEYMIDNKKGN